MAYHKPQRAGHSTVDGSEIPNNNTFWMYKTRRK